MGASIIRTTDFRMVDFKRALFQTIVGIFFVVGSMAPARVEALPEIQTWQSPKGAKVLFVQSKTLPMVDIRIIFDAGSARDNGVSGLAVLTNALLAEGAGGNTAQELAESFESVGAEFDNDAMRDMALVSVRTLTEKKYLDVAVTTLTKVLNHPDFNQKEFDRELARMKVAVDARKQSPSAIADEAFYKTIYGDHPYASPSGGTTESLKNLTVVDVGAFYRQYYVTTNATVVVVGALDRKQVEAIVNSLMVDLPVGEVAAALPEVSELSQKKTIHIPYPSSQSHILVGQPGMKRGDDDYFTLYVANHAFGGSGFSSRLVESIREDRGLAYSVYSYFLPMRETGPFKMGMQTKVEQLQEAIDLLQIELQQYVAEGVDEKELKDSISNITGGFPLNVDSNKKLLGYLAMIGFYNLPENYLNTFISKVESVKKEDVALALKRRLHADKMVTVIVGGEFVVKEDVAEKEVVKDSEEKPVQKDAIQEDAPKVDVIKGAEVKPVQKDSVQEDAVQEDAVKGAKPEPEPEKKDATQKDTARDAAAAE
jgi:zinc protease